MSEMARRGNKASPTAVMESRAAEICTLTGSIKRECRQRGRIYRAHGHCCDVRNLGRGVGLGFACRLCRRDPGTLYPGCRRVSLSFHESCHRIMGEKLSSCRGWEEGSDGGEACSIMYTCADL